MMKKWLLELTALLMGLAVSCNKENQPSGGEAVRTNLPGVWELTDVSTKVSVGSVAVNVYIDFKQDGTFVLYQKIGEGRYSRFDGSYTVGEDKSLSGSYTGGKAWGPYGAEITDGKLILMSANGTETDTYKKIDSLPPTVTSQLY